MRAAAEVADAAYERAALGHGLAGRTEREVARSIVRFLEDEGADEAVVPADRRGGRARGAAARRAARRGDPARARSW